MLGVNRSLFPSCWPVGLPPLAAACGSLVMGHKDSTRAVDVGALPGTLEVHGGALEAEEGGAWLASGASPQIAP